MEVVFSSALVEIRAAEGGNDAKLLVEDLFKIYEKWCRIKNFSTEISYICPSRIEFVVRGEKAYKLFLPEAGGHRFQRIPPTEKKGRRHTSTVTVAVLPVVPEVEFKINENDLKWITTTARGHGGQNVNKLETAVRLEHVPSGMVVNCQDERKQGQNKKRALEVLRTKLYAKSMQESLDKENSSRKAQIGSGQRGDKIRTLRYQDGKVTNHMNGKKVNLTEVLNGNLDILR
jgi:peptide chain release factor 1